MRAPVSAKAAPSARSRIFRRWDSRSSALVSRSRKGSRGASVFVRVASGCESLTVAGTLRVPSVETSKVAGTLRVPSVETSRESRVSPSDGTRSVPATLANVVRINEEPARRWYPVIDFSRCTNCMECIDFCLFGVYGVDSAETILVEQPDNCRKGCPACSRVCPENAIIFPQHKTPAIAGSPEVAGGAAPP